MGKLIVLNALTSTTKLKSAILRVLRDEYLHSATEISKELSVSLKDVQVALYELKQENRVSTVRRRWSIV